MKENRSELLCEFWLIVLLNNTLNFFYTLICWDNSASDCFAIFLSPGGFSFMIPVTEIISYIHSKCSKFSFIKCKLFEYFITYLNILLIKINLFKSLVFFFCFFLYFTISLNLLVFRCLDVISSFFVAFDLLGKVWHNVEGE